MAKAGHNQRRRATPPKQATHNEQRIDGVMIIIWLIADLGYQQNVKAMRKLENVAARNASDGCAARRWKNLRDPSMQ